MHLILTQKEIIKKAKLVNTAPHLKEILKLGFGGLDWIWCLITSGNSSK